MDYDPRRPDYCYGCADYCVYECPDHKQFHHNDQPSRRDDHYCHNCTVFAPARCPATALAAPGPEPV